MTTRADVARLAKVSKSTVSRVLNNSGYVSDDSRQRIEDAIKTLDYRPNLVARSLKTNVSKQLLFHVPDWQNPFYTEVFVGMDAYAQEMGYSIVVSAHLDPTTMTQRHYDGIILSIYNEGIQSILDDIDLPYVVTNFTVATPDCPYVGVDVVTGIQEAFGHLFEKGYTEFGMITEIESDLEDRFQSAQTMAALKHKIIHKIYHPISNESTYEAGYQAAKELYQQHPSVNALFAFNDAMAIGAMHYFHTIGLSLPKDMAIVGFDNITASNYTNPPLTTIHIPKFELGRATCHLLIQLIDGVESTNKVLTTSLVIRATS